MTEISFVDLDLGGRAITIEYAWIARSRTAAPFLVFLHEGLGSLAMWKDYPQRLCDAGGYRGLVYSRPGYGRSTPRAAGERWPVDVMHIEAGDVLPGLFARLGIGAAGDEARRWLIGHSDGASIALIHAAQFPGSVAGVVAIAPHLFVEEVTIRSITAARDAYRSTGLRSRLARYHDDADSAFQGWSDIWLDPRFRNWSIDAMLPALRCPILAVQGLDDEYGTPAQVRGIERQAPHAELILLADCGHSPHRDQPDVLTRSITEFIERHSPAPACHGGTP